MRHRIRMQSYISPDADRKFRAFATARGLTGSAVVDAAIAQYCDDGRVEEALVVRRLDSLVQAVTQVQHDMEVVSLAVGAHARFSFLVAPATLAPEAQKRADTMNLQFLATVSREHSAGVRFSGEVRRARADRTAPPGAVRAQGE
jgi:hypothetical protein